MIKRLIELLIIERRIEYIQYESSSKPIYSMKVRQNRITHVTALVIRH